MRLSIFVDAMLNSSPHNKHISRVNLIFLFRVLYFCLFAVLVPASADYHPIFEYDPLVLASLRHVHCHSCASGLPIIRAQADIRQRD